VPLTRLNGHTSILFEFIAGDSTTDGEFIPRHHLEYQYQLLADNKYCSAHLSDPFTEWTNFPEHGAVIVGGEPPTLYNDLYSMDCVWVFTLRVRDPNGNIGTDTRLVYQSVGRE
jgi:hypothetical protein